MTTRNSNARFDLAPQVAIERSTMDRSCDIKTSFNVGELIPFYVDEVLPGDTFQIETSKVARLQTLITPVMDNLYLDTYYFFVPNRLVWEHWKQFMGENTINHWYQTSVEYTIPTIRTPSGGFASGTVADYMGVPIGVDLGQTEDKPGINALPFRAYGLIYNEWFRDENLTNADAVPVNDTYTTGVNNASTYKGLPFKVCKYHDYFTSALPAPQKGPDVPFLDGLIPVIPNIYNDNDVKKIYNPNGGSATSPFPTHHVKLMDLNTSNLGKSFIGSDSSSELKSGVTTNNIGFGADYSYAMFKNLFADLTHTVPIEGSINPMTINALRRCFQIQRLYEKDARGGKTYCLHVKKIAEKNWKAA